MDSNFCRFDIFDSEEQTLLHSVVIPVSQCHEAYMLYAFDTGNVVKVYDSENVLRISSKLFNTI